MARARRHARMHACTHPPTHARNQHVCPHLLKSCRRHDLIHLLLVLPIFSIQPLSTMVHVNSVAPRVGQQPAALRRSQPRGHRAATGGPVGGQARSRAKDLRLRLSVRTPLGRRLGERLGTDWRQAYPARAAYTFCLDCGCGRGGGPSESTREAHTLPVSRCLHVCRPRGGGSWPRGWQGRPCCCP
jgi:hypothetical protein